MTKQKQTVLRSDSKAVYYRDKAVGFLLDSFKRNYTKDRVRLKHAAIEWLVKTYKLTTKEADIIVGRNVIGRALGCWSAVRRGQSRAVDRNRKKRRDVGKDLLARAMRFSPTPGESKIQRELGRLYPGLFEFQIPILGFIADNYSEELRLVIEIDGGSHAGRENYDRQRDLIFARRGIKTVRVSEQSVIDDLATVMATIKRHVSER